MLGSNKVFRNGSATIVESWNGRSMLKRLVQETSVKLTSKGKVIQLAGLKAKERVS